ncbi:RHS repeat-associated core domain-containing protein [Nitrospirillum sp. BR 11163]|uniref:RHS repeat domain-containing protein n=1 Tax=Nitrospirillum sp. BR 11163 TaxID=3104323 RepID=UPI002AFEA0BF|nr:RHS repeat-associated core domain-containing protein [Nitrospirillum sp. BR 11163]MEA1675399.1 RHS repeat-associated core domain-containing protein [Nitrospirillum sp. BR 11163]
MDLGTGAFRYSTTEVVIGQPGAGGLSYTRYFIGSNWRDDYIGGINKTGTTYIVSLGGSSESFTSSDGANFTNNGGTGSTLSVNGTLYTYTAADGSVATFDKNYCCIVNDGYSTNIKASEGRITQLVLPSGETRIWKYQFQKFCDAPGSGAPCFVLGRIQSVYNNFGYQIRYIYGANNTSSLDAYGDWLTLTGVVGFNMAVETCAPESQTCTLGSNWPKISYAKPSDDANARTATDNLGRVTRYKNGITAIRRPSSGTDNITIGYDGAGRVSSVNNGAGTWSYTYADSGNIRTTTVTDPLSHQRVVTTDLATGQILTDKDALGNTTTYSYDSYHRLTQVTRPEGDYVTYDHDSRGNVTKTTKYGKPGSGLVVWSEATYESGCSNPKTCNKPSASHDDNGHWTYYAYDPTHGGVQTITRDAPGAGKAQPQVRYSYGPYQAYYKNSSGNLTGGGTIYLPTGTSTCVNGNWTGSACDSTGNNGQNGIESKTSIGYGDTSGSQANNLLPVSMTQSSGDGSVSATTSVTYDSVGNKLTVTGPANTGTTRYRYDAARQMVGVVGPAAGASGKYRATAISYNPDGQVTDTSQGTVNSQSDGDWSNFVTLQKTTAIYDGQGRKTWDVLKDAGGNELVTTAYGYDAANNLIWTTRPMKGTGDDRWINYGYDAAGRLTQVRDTSNQIISGTSYTANGLKATMVDGNNHTTSYTYDGFNRLTLVTYPTANGATYSDAYGYDNASQMTSWRQRDNQTTMGYTRDALEQVTNRSVGNFNYSYDNLGHVTQATADGKASVTTVYDALGRLTSQTTDGRKVSAQYDAAGRLQRLIWPDGTYADYSYDTTGAMTGISVNGNWVQSYSYDDLGRRQSTTRANGVTSVYCFDSASRLTFLDLGGTAGQCSDSSPRLTSLSFGYNLAGQILKRTNSNAAYDVPVPTNGTTNYANNELNQTTSVSGPSGTSSLTYGPRGNLYTYGATTTAHDADSQMASVSPATSLGYDAMGRLSQVSQSSTTRFLYFGNRLVAEYDSSGNVLRRYIPGAATDETAVWYEGSTTAAGRWLIPDERGSVVAVTDGGGTALAVNTYDEYGRPGAGNMGRFQYTGQAYLAEASVYYYKARMYLPGLGKFLETDPTGYAAGMNLYAYAGGDPINRADPMGLADGDVAQEVVVTGTRPAGLIINQLGTEVVSSQFAYRKLQQTIFVKTTDTGPQSAQQPFIINDPPIINLGDEMTEIIVTAAVPAYRIGKLLFDLGIGAAGGVEIGTILSNGLVAGADALGAAPNLVRLGKKFGINASSEVGANILQNLNTPVSEFIAQNRLGSILSVFPSEYLGGTVGQALQQGGSTVRKLLLDSRFAK